MKLPRSLVCDLACCRSCALEACYRRLGGICFSELLTFARKLAPPLEGGPLNLEAGLAEDPKGVWRESGIDAQKSSLSPIVRSRTRFCGVEFVSGLRFPMLEWLLAKKRYSSEWSRAAARTYAQCLIPRACIHVYMHTHRARACLSQKAFPNLKSVFPNMDITKHPSTTTT